MMSETVSTELGDSALGLGPLIPPLNFSEAIY